MFFYLFNPQIDKNSFSVVSSILFVTIIIISDEKFKSFFIFINKFSYGYIESQTEFFIHTNPAFLSRYRRASLSLFLSSGKSRIIILQFPSQLFDTKAESSSIAL